MSEMRWYNELVARLIKEKGMSEYALARDSKVSICAVRNAINGRHYISMETLEKILLTLGFKIEPVPFFSPVILPVKQTPQPTPPAKPAPVQKFSIPADKDSYCWGCGKDGTMIRVAGHDQCNRCGYIDPCCED